MNPASTPVPLVIDVKGVTKRFGKKTVVDHIDMSIPQGTVFGFLGPNGSGKTTFIRMLCGLLEPNGGSGTCLGYDILKERRMIKQHVGYMTQRFSYYEDLTVRENLDFVARVYGIADRRKTVQQSIEAIGLAGRANQLAGTLSGGWKQRLALAACMLHKPQLLLLDEPTAGVDPKARREFWDEIHKLAREGMTILVTTHYMDEAERCHQLAYIAYGKLLAQGEKQTLIDDAGLHTRRITGPDLPRWADQLREQPGVAQAVMFGSSLHLSGKDPETLENTIHRHLKGTHQWEARATSLEEVFIHLMSHSEDNFAAVNKNQTTHSS